MSYLTQAQDPKRRASALAATLAINGAIGALIVTGLTMSGTRIVDAYDPPTLFPTPKPPPPEPAPTPPPVDYTAPTPPAPIPPIPIPQPPGPPRDAFDPNADLVPNLPVIPDPGPSITPSPRPSPNFAPRAARPSNESSRWITTNDYPRRSLIDGSEGVARYRLVIGTNGNVSSCEVTASTGDSLLDQATCRHITRRARFEAATDENGAKVMGTYTGSVRWEIPN